MNYCSVYLHRQYNSISETLKLLGAESPLLQSQKKKDSVKKYSDPDAN